MKTIDLYLFLTSYIWTVAIANLAELFSKRKAGSVIPNVLAVGLLIANTAIGDHIDAERGYLEVLRYLINQRDVSSLIALLMGCAAGFIWLTRITPATDFSAEDYGRRRGLWLAMSMFLVVACGHAFIWSEVSGTTRHAVSVSAPEFEIEEIAVLDDQPLRIAVDDEGSVYVCFDYFKKHGAWGGAVIRFRQNSETGEFERKTVVESPLLARCYGLLVRDGDLYVSRAGYFPEARMGQVSYLASGAITQLRDLDGDGYYEYAHDVITGLPGVRAPDTMQQNNGIAFGSDGSLYVTNASAADRTLDEHPWGGSILRYNPDFAGPEIVAKGFRNPWTIAIGPDGALFVTDSDVDENPGDEINHVIPGEHYGHPFVIPNEQHVKAIGFRDPVFVGEREAVFLGLVYTTAPTLPDHYRDCMYVTDFRRNQVLRLELKRAGDTYQVSNSERFLSIPTPVDMAITPSGDMFVISRRAQKLYRVRLKNKSADGKE